MFKMFNFRKILLLLTSFITFTTFSYSDDGIKELKMSLDALEAWTWESDEDIYEIAMKTSSLLEDILSKQTLGSVVDSTNFEYSRSKGNKLNVYTFSYNSGGTKGRVYETLVQWKKSSKGFGVINMGEKRLSDIYEIEDDRGDLFLLLGTETGSSIILLHYIYCLHVDGDELNRNFPLFYDKYSKIDITDRIESDNFINYDYNPEERKIIIENMTSGDEIIVSNSNESTVLDNSNDIILKYINNTFK